VKSVRSASIVAQATEPETKKAVSPKEQKKVDVVLHARVSDADYSLRMKRERVIKQEMLR
jgi:hypothetical protein